MCCGESLAQGHRSLPSCANDRRELSAEPVTRRVASHVCKKSCALHQCTLLLCCSEAVRPTLLLHHHVDHVACVELSSGDHRLTDFLHPPFTFPALLTPLGGGRANTKHHHARHRTSSPSSMSSCQATEAVRSQARASMGGSQCAITACSFGCDAVEAGRGCAERQHRTATTPQRDSVPAAVSASR